MGLVSLVCDVRTLYGMLKIELTEDGWIGGRGIHIDVSSRFVSKPYADVQGKSY